MRAVGRAVAGVAVFLAGTLTPLTIPAAPSYAGEPSSSAPACPPSPTLLTSTTPSGTAPAPTTIAVAAAAAPTTSPYRPAPDEVVACVGPYEITGATFAHWAMVVEKSATSGHPPTHTNPAAQPSKPVMETALGFLTSADWVLGEAADLKIDLSAGAVRHQFDHLRNQQFPKRAAFKKFLKQTGQTVGDLMLRVRLGILTTRIQRHVAGHGSARRRQRALKRFVKHFEHKWRAQTYCEPLYKVPHCGHTADSL